MLSNCRVFVPIQPKPVTFIRASTRGVGCVALRTDQPRPKAVGCMPKLGGPAGAGHAATSLGKVTGHNEHYDDDARHERHEREPLVRCIEWAAQFLTAEPDRQQTTATD